MAAHRLFAVMPFGVRPVANANGGKLDFDLIYNDVLKEAAKIAEWSIFRIDESPQTGSITDQYLHELATAELVVGDISTVNANVYYELGVRHSLSSSGTILIAHEDSTIPFDLQNQRIIFYRTSPEGLKQLEKQITQVLRRYIPGKATNPVYTYLQRVGVVASPSKDPASFEQEVQSKVDRASSPDQLIGLWEWLRTQTPLPPLALSSLADRLASFERWEPAAAILRAAVKLR